MQLSRQMSYVNSRSVIGFRAARARKERQARAAVKSGRTFGESNCHGKVGYHVYNKTWEAADGEALVHVRKIARKRFRSINCGCERGIVIGHLP